MMSHRVIKNPTLTQILKVDKEVKEETEKYIKTLISNL